MDLEPVAKPRLLIVDDVAENRSLLSRRFKRKGFECVEADGGTLALELIRDSRFDLVLLDIMMPVIDGLEVLTELRKRHSADDLPVIMVTGRVQGEDIAGALNLGANDYVTKPVDFNVVFARVQTQLARKRAVEALQQSLGNLEEAKRLLEEQIAERTRADARLLFVQHHDVVTGLGNRALLCETLDWRLRGMSESIGLVCIGIDGFATVSAVYGQDDCDTLARQVVERLTSITAQAGQLWRLSQTEFVLLSPSPRSAQDLSRLAERCISALAESFDLKGTDISLTATAGIVLAENTGDDASTLIKNACLALQGAKSDGRGRWRFFAAEMNTRAHERQAFEAELRKAVVTGDFRIHYQPIMNIGSREIAGYEALIRWRHPEKGDISPAIFIPIAEECGLMGRIGDWVLRRACEEASAFAQGRKIAINISAVQFDNHTLVQNVISALAASGLPPRQLELEITETALLGDRDVALDTLCQLRALGVHISLDDFGTGYSSLNYLRDFPFDRIKIDQSFVRVQTGQSETRAIVRAISGLARDLGMATTAEGVETQAQLDWLIAEGCTDAQGYLIGRPAPASEFMNFETPQRHESDDCMRVRRRAAG